jgi:hypothetical protein
MEEIRIKKLEMTMHTLSRRFDDHEQLYAQDAMWRQDADRKIDMHTEALEELRKQTAIFIQIASAIQNMSIYAEKTHDVVLPLVKIIRYAIKYGAYVGAMFIGIRAAIAWVSKIYAAHISGAI